MTGKHVLILAFTLLTATLSGCASFSRGVTEAIMARETEDTRQCWINGREFEGLDHVFERNEKIAGAGKVARLKVLKVHGIGEHSPGYSQNLQNGLIEEHGFDAVDETVKTIHLTNQNYEGELGTLRVNRYMDRQRSREMLFYELTWDPIVEAEKQLVSFDNTEESSARRVALNHTLKTFINTTVPDVLMYNTRFREPIQFSIAQAVCWMLSEDWHNLPDESSASCVVGEDEYWTKVDDSAFAVISHSMGSRISIDALQTVVTKFSERPDYKQRNAAVQNRPIYLYMLSNQLPLLQLGQPLPPVHDQVASYCSTGGERYDERFLQKLQIVAFSDPNDLFSYAVNPEYIYRYVDSRLCPQVTNVLIQVAPVTSVLGLQEIANPEAAHLGYETDSRVLKMLVSGFGQEYGQEEPKERCEFIETVPSY